MAAADNVILVDPSSNAVALTLPVPTNGRILEIKDSTGSAATHNITINPNASETIDGASSKVLNMNYQSMSLVSDGVNWFVEGSYPAGSGTVTSVALTVPSFLSVSGSPITTSGTLAVTLSGTALPAINGGTGQTAYTIGDVLYASSTTALSKLGIGSTNNALIVSGGVPAWSSGTLTGSNSGDVTLTAYGSSPAADGASLSGQALTLQPADGTHPGGVSITTQTFAGSKTIGFNAADQIVIGASGSSAQHAINGGLTLTTNTVSAATYNIV